MVRHQDLVHAEGINLVDERINPVMKTPHSCLFASEKVKHSRYRPGVAQRVPGS